jgi:hypothetical protein
MDSDEEMTDSDRAKLASLSTGSVLDLAETTRDVPDIQQR